MKETTEQIAARLEALAIGCGVPEEHFDMDVHDAAQDAELETLNSIEDEDDQEDHISGVEHDASDVNNAGFACQFRFLLENGWTEEGIIERMNEED